MNNKEKNAVEYLKTRLYGNESCKYIDVAQEDLRIFINLIDSLQKENEELKILKDDIQDKRIVYVDTPEFEENYISAQKIKDELEELKGKLEDISRRREKSKTKEEETVLWCLEIRTDERIKTLHELLENYKMNPKQ